jgi:hypothetical protein
VVEHEFFNAVMNEREKPEPGTLARRARNEPGNQRNG